MKKKQVKKPKKNNSLAETLSSIGTAHERDYIVENLSTLIAAHVNVIDAFESIHNELKSDYLKKKIKTIQTAIKKGVPMWRALDESRLFPQSILSLIKVGEQTGQLTENLKVVAERNRKNRSFRTKLRSAMMYPVFVLSLTVVIATGIAWFILPKLAQVFNSLKLDLPAVTKIIIDIGALLGTHGAIIVPAFFVFIFLVVFFVFIFKKTRHIGQALLLAMPGIGRLIREVEVARFGYLLGTLLESGIPLNESLESLVSSTTTRRYEKFYTYLKTHILRGYSFQYVFTHYRKTHTLIPGPVQQMVVTGEKSGRLSYMLMDISRLYEEKIDATTKNVSVLLEPFLLVIVWLGVMGLALSVVLPIYGLLGGLR